MINIADTNGGLARWRLYLANFYFTVLYRLGLANKVADALSRCTPVERVYSEFDDDIPTFEGEKLEFTRAQPKAYTLDENGDEDLDLYYAMDKVISDKQEDSGDEPLSITIRENVVTEICD